MARLLRTAILILVSLALFVGGYWLLGVVLPDPTITQQDQERVDVLMPREGPGMIGATDRVTLRTHDTRTGEPIAEIRVNSYRRVSEHEIELSEITATIMIEDGGLIMATSPLGRIDVEATTPRDRFEADMLGTAEFARLEDVTVRWYMSAADAAAGRDPRLTIRVDNIVVDQTRASIFTADTVIDGSTVLADDVPIVVRGDDYDFDGRGLLIRWDPASRRPNLVRVARGERLTIKNPDVLPALAGAGGSAERGFQRGAESEPLVRVDLPAGIVNGAAVADRADRTVREPLARGYVLTSLDSDDAGDVARSSEPTQPPPTRTPYAARFHDEVRVEQGGQVLLAADWAEAVFTFELPAGGLGEPREPTPLPEASPAPPREQDAVDEQAEEPSDAGPPVDQTDSAAETDPAVHAAAEPITLSWSGPLRVEPAAADEQPLIARDDFRVRLRGSPMVISYEEAELTARSLSYDAGADLLQLRGVEDQPIVLTDGEGNFLRIASADVYPRAGHGRIDGPGHAEIAQVEGLEGLEAPAEASWSQWVTFSFEELPDGGLAMREAEADGSVRIRHPELTLDSERLLVRMAELDGRQVLRYVEATDSVRCIVETGEEHPAELTGERVVLDLPEGEDGPIEVIAAGDVVIEYEGALVRAQTITARLEEDASGRRDLAALDARGNVSGRDEHGYGLEAEQVTFTIDEVGRLVTLLGSDERDARVHEERGVLAARRIEFRPDDESVLVPMRGQLEMRDDAGQPVIVTWDERLEGGRESVLVRGRVAVETTATAEGLDRRLSSVSREAQLTLGGEDGTGVELVDVIGEVRSTFEERDEEGLLTRSFDLRTERLLVWPGQEAVRIEIPTAGRALARDLRADLRPGGAARNGAPGRNDAGANGGIAGEILGADLEGFRGNVAFGWQERLTYDPNTQILALIGEATLAMEQAGRPAFRLTSDRFEIQMRQAGEAIEVVAAEASGRVRFASTGVQFEAGTVRYDPANETLVARGGAERQSVVLLDERGVPAGRFGELVYNLETGQIDRLTDLRAGR